MFLGRFSVTGPNAVVCVWLLKNGLSTAAPPGMPALLIESIRLNLRALPCPLTRGRVLRSGVYRGTRRLTGASRSYAVRPVSPTGLVGVQSFWMSPTNVDWRVFSSD